MIRMIFFFLLVFCCGVESLVSAQSYRATYEVVETNGYDGEVKRDLFILDISGTGESLFKSYYRMLRDSVMLAGIENNLSHAEISNNMRKTTPGDHLRIHFSGQKKEYTVLNYAVTYLLYREPAREFDISFTDDTKNVSGYSSKKVLLNYYGRDWIVYYTEEVPLPFGPWKLNGFPGLVTEASTLDGLFQFTLKSFTRYDQAHLGIYDNVVQPTKVKYVSREEFLWAMKQKLCGDTRPVARKYLPSMTFDRSFDDKIDQRYRKLSKRFQYIEK